jgi:hypothetical protein
MFKPGSDRLENGAKFGVSVKFAEVLFFMVRQPAASINPKDKNMTKSTFNFIGGSVIQNLILI